MHTELYLGKTRALMAAITKSNEGPNSLFVGAVLTCIAHSRNEELGEGTASTLSLAVLLSQGDHSRFLSLYSFLHSPVLAAPSRGRLRS